MRLTRAEGYAVRALIRLAAPESLGKPVASHVLAGRDMPERFLLKVLHPLVNAGILTSLKGPHGGYRLCRPAKEITLLEVTTALNGPQRNYVPEFDGMDEPTAKAMKRVNDIMKYAAQAGSRCLAKKTLAELMK